MVDQGRPILPSDMMASHTSLCLVITLGFLTYPPNELVAPCISWS